MAPSFITRSCAGIALMAVGILAGAACSSATSPAGAPPGLTCASPGEATVGPADTHCAGQPVQVVNSALCVEGADGLADGANGLADGAAALASNEGPADDGGTGDDGGLASATECAYGATLFGASQAGVAAGEGDDDDCKYHVAWTSTPICQSTTLGVLFRVTLTYLATGLPVTDIPATEGVLPEAFIPSVLDASCDTMTTHPSPTPFGSAHMFETTPTSGVYFGPIIFDQPGEWTVRFHIHEECSDTTDSPHGHAAFHVTVP